MLRFELNWAALCQQLILFGFSNTNTPQKRPRWLAGVVHARVFNDEVMLTRRMMIIRLPTSTRLKAYVLEATPPAADLMGPD